MTKYLPKEIQKVLEVSEKRENLDIFKQSSVDSIKNPIAEKDLYEAVGFQNGFQPHQDARAINMIGIVLLLNFFDRINLVYQEYEDIQNKKEQQEEERKE